nr:antibiotic biosynthesis monooxygenase [uncultured Flavobacterium sp.]
MMTTLLSGSAFAQNKNLVVRIAKLEIDVAQLESYKSILKEEMETSVRVESGVLSLYAVSDKANPASITVFEIYANDDAYNTHIQTTHFKRYKNTTMGMVKSLELLNTDPIALEAKKKLQLK